MEEIKKSGSFLVEGVFPVPRHRKDIPGVELDLVFSLQPCEFDSSSKITKVSQKLNLPTEQLTIYSVESHTMMSIMQWFTKNPLHRRIDLTL